MPTGKVLAVKKVQIYEIMDTKQRADCVNEVKLLQSFNHPNIIKFHESYIDQRFVHIVMELCRGGEFFDHIIAKKGFDEQHTKQYLSQMLSAL